MLKQTFPQRWLRLQTRELDAELRKLNLPFVASEALRDAVKAEKTRIKSERAKRRVRLARWGVPIRQAKYEAHKVALRLQHTHSIAPGRGTPARIEALDFYDGVLRECIRRMEDRRDNLDAPLPQTQDYRDFIPDKIKAQVRLRFNAIPHEEGKRIAAPFGEPRPAKAGSPTDGQAVRQFNPGEEGEKQ